MQQRPSLGADNAKRSSQASTSWNRVPPSSGSAGAWPSTRCCGRAPAAPRPERLRRQAVRDPPARRADRSGGGSGARGRAVVLAPLWPVDEADRRVHALTPRPARRPRRARHGPVEAPPEGACQWGAAIWTVDLGLLDPHEPTPIRHGQVPSPYDLRGGCAVPRSQRNECAIEFGTHRVERLVARLVGQHQHLNEPFVVLPLPASGDLLYRLIERRARSAGSRGSGSSSVRAAGSGA
jgi:hypothetical protein